MYELQAITPEEAEKWVKAISEKTSKIKKKVEEEDKILEKTTSILVEGQKSEKNVTLDDFDLLCVLGRGSFGKVMKVRKKDTKEVFAMKSFFFF